MFWVLFIAYIIMTTTGLFLIKTGGSGMKLAADSTFLSVKLGWKFIVGLVCYIISFLLFTVVLQKKDLSFIYPLSAGLVNVATVLLGVFLLGEKIRLTGVIGVIAIVFGVVLLNLK